MKVSLKIYRLFFFAFLLAILGSGTALAKPFTVAVIGEEPAEDIKKTFPLAGYLSKQLESDGFTQGKVLVAKSMNEMASLLREGKVDLHFDSYARTLALNRLAGSKPILRRWKKGVAEYYGVIFTRSDSGVRRLEDLRGKTIALEEEFSTVGHLLPKYMFLEKGVKLAMSDGRVSQDSVAYSFAYWDANTMLWVLKGKAAAGAMDSQTFSDLGGKYGEQLRVIATTPSVPRHIVSVRRALPQDLLVKVKDVLMHMDRSEEGKKALQQFERTAKFDELSEANTALIQRLGRLIEAEIKLP
jgi:phosphonate transport system substrate-binding protein